MKRILITGAKGFVGAYAGEAFSAESYHVIRAGHGELELDIALSLADADQVRQVVAFAQPDCVLHLAAQSFVPAAVKDPLETYDINVMGTARLVDALRHEQRPIRLMYVSSAEVYGYRALQTLPLSEKDVPLPANPYAASKLAAEQLALAGRSDNLEVVVVRPFNHIGPGQDPRFVVAGFARQLADILAGAEPVLAVGNLEAERDFLDVRDVATAYVRLMETGTDGEIYNLCSGKPVAIREILRQLITLAGVPITVRQDAARMRASDVPCFYGRAAKLQRSSGWSPKFSLDQSLEAIFGAAREAGLRLHDAPTLARCKS